jgi:hypothetical protein
MATDAPTALIIGIKAEGRSLETVTKQLTAPEGQAPAPVADPAV